LIGLEIVKDRKTKKPGNEEIKRVNFEAFSRGLLTAYDGLNGNVFRLMPSLTLSEELAGLGCEILAGSFDACAK
jgi:4-aminobutyrate aminotransferase/(S)-3-amino-2-methylpropionate transaminase